MKSEIDNKNGSAGVISKLSALVLFFLLVSVACAPFVSGYEDHYEPIEMEDGDAYFREYQVKGVNVGDGQMSISFNFELLTYASHEDFGGMVIEIFEYQVVEDFSEISYDNKINELEFTPGFIEDSLEYGGSFVPGTDGRIESHIETIGGGVSGYLITGQFTILPDEFDIEGATTTRSELRELQEFEKAFTPITISVEFLEDDIYDWHDGYFEGEDPSLRWASTSLTAGPFMQEVARIANFLTIGAGSVGALALIWMAYKWMNPLLDPEEKKKIREDAMRWATGLFIVFSARLIAAIFEYIGSGEITVMVVLI